MAWQDDAACINVPSEIFHPTIVDEEGVEWFDDGTIWEAFGDTSGYYDQARSICEQCPVRQACLSQALQEKERWGMWGGLTPIERRRIERKKRRDRLKERRSGTDLGSVEP